jgi:predicted amidophosphoribosyltransferase
MAYALAHMGLARSNIEYNPDADLEAHTNSRIHTRLTSFLDPRTEERLDPEIVMRVGQGKKHGRFWLGDDILDTGSTLTLYRL